MYAVYLTPTSFLVPRSCHQTHIYGHQRQDDGQWCLDYVKFCTVCDTIIIIDYVIKPRKAGGFLRRQRGGGGFHRKSGNIAIGQINALKSWPYTSKFTNDHPEQI